MGLAETIALTPPAVRLEEDGSIRVAGTRVLLDTVIDAFETGASAEEIAYNYDSLRLEDVYAAISYYLRNKDTVRAYMAQRQAEGDDLRREIEAMQPDRAALRRTLLERRDGTRSTD